MPANPDIHNFLSELFENKSDDALIQIWTLTNKKNAYFTTVDDAAKYAAILQNDVFVGCGLSPENFGPSKRCKLDQITGIPGFYIDIDYADPVHQKTNLPPDMDAAVALVNEFEYVPTMIVHTGHGIHGWWLFKEPWEFETDDERTQAAQLEQRLNYQIKSIAAQKKWDVDSVFDLSRILRIPGTYNCKDYLAAKKRGEKAEKIPVTILSINKNARYNPEDFDTVLDSIEKLNGTSTSVTSAEINKTLTKIKSAPAFIQNDTIESRMQEMISVHGPELAQLWITGKKHTGDQSPSGSDMSLAIYAAQSHWSSAETNELLRYFRIKHGRDLKENNDQYYARTIVSAREFVKKKDAEDFAKKQEYKARHQELTDKINAEIREKVVAEFEPKLARIKNKKSAIKIEKQNLDKQKTMIALTQKEISGQSGKTKEKLKIRLSAQKTKYETNLAKYKISKQQIKNDEQSLDSQIEATIKSQVEKHEQKAHKKLDENIAKEQEQQTKQQQNDEFKKMLAEYIVAIAQLPPEFGDPNIDPAILDDVKMRNNPNVKKFYKITKHFFGFEILKIVHVLQENPFYLMTIRDYTPRGITAPRGIVVLKYKDLDIWPSQIRHRNFLYTHLKHRPPKLPGNKWDAIIDALGLLFVEKEDVAETTYHGMLTEALIEYLQDRPILTKKQGLIEKQPFKIKGDWCIFFESFYRYASQTSGIDINKINMVNILKGEHIEAKRCRTSIRLPSTNWPQRRVYWRIPKQKLDMPVRLKSVSNNNSDTDDIDDIDDIDDLDDLDDKKSQSTIS